MISEEKNRQLTQVGPGTPMGELLRRYWMPIAGVSEFDARATKRVRLLGEDLVLYKDLSGTFGLLQRHCPHRAADLSLGTVEQCGLRCHYHGWMFREDGQCLAQPYEDIAHPERRMRDKMKARAYPVAVKADMIWAYLGPAPVPEVPDWEMYHWDNGFRQVVISEIPCNWFQCQENSIDPVHFEWMHDNWGKRLRGDDGAYGSKHTKVDFDEFDYGFIYRRTKEDQDESSEMWTVGRVCLWPNALFTGEHIEWRVPIDDENTLSVTWTFTRVPRDCEPFVQGSVPTWHGPVVDAQGEWINTHVMNQDFIAWVGQGRISDRTQEHLGPSDKGILMIRRRYFDDMARVANGEDPKAVIRDPSLSAIPLPIVNRKRYTEGLERDKIPGTPLGRWLREGYVLQAGQPDAVREAFEDAMAPPR